MIDAQKQEVKTMALEPTTTDPGKFYLNEVLSLDDTLRDDPTAEFTDRMHQRYPTEREFDRMLTRKLQNRSQPRRPNSTLDELAARLQSFLDAHVDGEFTARDHRWLSGGASKIQLAFELEWDDPEVGHTKTQMVLRMEPQESLNATSRRRELQLLNALAGTIPVPRAYWVDNEAQWFPEPTLVYAFATGITKPRGVSGQPTGVGNPFPPDLGRSLGHQFVEHLAAIHTFDASRADFSAFDVPSVGTDESAIWQLNRARRVWEEDRGEDLPLLEVAANWLERHAPPLDVVSVLHGDYRAGNFLFDQDSADITAWLDWERGYLGDRHRDLAWITLPQFGNYTADGTTLLVSGLIPVHDFYAEYERASGLSIDPVRLRYYRIMNAYQLVASTLGSAYRVVRLGKSHQDILLAWLEGVVYSLADDLRLAILEDN